MAANVFILFILTSIINTFICIDFQKEEFKNEHFVYWPKGIVPFYIEPNHFDRDQRMLILAGLTRFTSKSCLQFRPVFVEPKQTNHVLVLENPHGIRKCVVNRIGHAFDEPHRVTLGFECLSSPNIDMIIMRALGFPFEHNRPSRDLFIDMLTENIEPGAVELFAREKILPPDLRKLAYDVNSVLHFSDRDYSKNGHRTFIFKNPQTVQVRIDLTATDLKKIDIVYGPECRRRDRLDKIDICKNYPTGNRRKREVEGGALVNITNLRINRNIHPLDNTTDDIDETIKDLDIKDQIDNLIESVHKISMTALKSANNKLCNSNETDVRTMDFVPTNITDIVDAVSNYVKQLVSDATANLTMFCNAEVKLPERCRESYWKPRSTKSGPVNPYTKHSPIMKQATKHHGFDRNPAFGSLRSWDNMTQTDTSGRVKREVENGPKSKLTPIVSKPPVTNNEGDIKIIATAEQNAYRRKDLGDNSGDSREEESVEESNESANKMDIDNDKIESEKEEKEEEKQQTVEQEESEYQKNNKKLENYNEKIKETSSEKVIKESSKVNNKELPKKTTEESSKQDKRESNKETKERSKGNKNQYNEEHTVEDKSDESDESEDEESTTEKFEQPKIDKQVKEQNKNSKREEEINKSYLPDRSSNKSNEPGESENEEDATSENNEKPNINKKENEEIERSSTPDRLTEKKNVTTKLPVTVPLTQLNKDYYADRIWPQGVVPYIIEENPDYDLRDVRERLNKVNEMLKKYTCIELQEIRKGEENKYQDYIVLDTSPDYVTGRVGGRQQFGVLELFKGGQHNQHAAMVVMAMLGFYFELARHDRDEYVRVHFRHIRPDKLHHFEKLRPDATLALPYDYKSATHPAWQFWRRVGKTGISTVATYKDKDPDGSIMKSLGQNSRLLSKLDIVKINSVYGTSCFEAGNSSESN